MTFLDLATDRFSVRKFDGRPVEEDKIQKMLQAWELGIGSCWIGAFSPADVAKEFDIDYEVLGEANGMLMVTASGTAVVID